MILRLAIFASALTLAACDDKGGDDSGDGGSGDDGANGGDPGGPGDPGGNGADPGGDPGGDGGDPGGDPGGDGGGPGGDNGPGGGPGGGDNGPGGDGGDPGGDGGAGTWSGGFGWLLYNPVADTGCYNYWWWTTGTISSNTCPDCEWSYDIDGAYDLAAADQCFGKATGSPTSYINGLLLDYNGYAVMLQTYDNWNNTYVNGYVLDGSGSGAIYYALITTDAYVDKFGNPYYYSYYGYGFYGP
jgi:hypothetical protein